MPQHEPESEEPSATLAEDPRDQSTQTAAAGEFRKQMRQRERVQIEHHNAV